MAPHRKGKTLSVRGVENLDGSGTNLVKMAGDIRDWQIACVCGGLKNTCNSGWMKELEDRAMPILIPLLQGKHVFLTPIQQEVIASWTALKCIVAEYEIGLVTTSREQRVRMYNFQKPPEIGWAVWIGRGTNQLNYPAWSSAALKITDNNNSEIDDANNQFNGHSTTQMIGELFIHVMRFPGGLLPQNWNFGVPFADKLSLIWPPSKSILNWPRDVLSPKEMGNIANSVRDYANRVAKNRR